VESKDNPQKHGLIKIGLEIHRLAIFALMEVAIHILHGLYEHTQKLKKLLVLFGQLNL
jgi:hypothetical protein